MASVAPRRRASTSVASPESVAELQAFLDILLERRQQSDNNGYIQKKLQAGHRIRQILLDTSSVNHAKDTFRRLDGFDVVMSTLIEVSECCEILYRTNEDDLELLDLMQIQFKVLSAALQEHKGNQRYFRYRTNGGGWLAIEKTSQALLQPSMAEKYGSSTVIAERLFGSLLACAFDDEALVGFFGRLRRRMDEHIDGSQDIDPASATRTILEKDIGSLALLQNPEALSTMFELWRTSIIPAGAADGLRSYTFISIPTIIEYVAGLSTHSLLALHGTGLLGSILSYMTSTSYDTNYASEFHSLAIPFLKLGVTNLNDACLLYRNATSSPLIADLLLLALQNSHSASYVHFDLSLYGYASIELPNIGRSFPPVSSSAGYTLSMWLYVVKFDPNSHTTIFGAFDSSQTCFVLVYFEKDTRNLILQTSVTSSRPSVRFKSTVFQEGCWYHISIVHRRPKPTSSSRASLFVNGEFVEQVKAHYPALPPSNSTSVETTGSLYPDRTSNPVQAFLGTPQDLASRLGKGVIFTQWRLASAHLFGDVLSDDLIAVHHQLGPRYNGNYQDSLGSFQTYQASAALNLRNESLHPGKEEKSDILTAIQQKAGHLLPESKILLNISSRIVLDDNEQSTRGETQLVNCLSKPARKTLRGVTRGGHNSLAINGAVPSINEALIHTFGFATITGDPAVAVPQSLDDASWRIGGCAAVGLALLEAAYNRDNIVRALKILLESVRHSWRNSEAMERENGFGVLSSLLAAKLSLDLKRNMSDVESSNSLYNDNDHAKLPTEVLNLILEFVGYRKDKPEDSVINNPLAYRVLLVDSGMWRSKAAAVQMLYFKQFSVFGVSSKYHRFNAKRLSRMRIVKKWLDALKGEPFTPDTLQYFIGAFKSILTMHPSAESLRSLALYVTYAIHKPKQKTSATLRATRSLKSRSNGSSPMQTPMTPSLSSLNNGNKISSELPQFQVALKILEMYVDILCKGNDTTNIKKFARTVTNKWLLHLLADEDIAVVVLATKILCRLLVVNGSSYVKKFAEKTGGFVIMKYRLKRWWNIPTVWPLIFAVLFGKDVATIDLGRTFDLFGLLDIFSGGGDARIVYPQVLPVITAMLQNGLRAVTRDQEDPDSPMVKKSSGNTLSPNNASNRPTHLRRRSMSLNTELTSLGESSARASHGVSHPSVDTEKPHEQRLVESISVIRTVTRFLADMHTNSQAFRDFAITSNYVQELLLVLFPIIVSSDIVSPETELHSRDSSLTFDGNDVMIRPLSRASTLGTPIVRTSSVEQVPAQKSARKLAPRRMSSYVLVTSNLPRGRLSPSEWQSTAVPDRTTAVTKNSSSSIVEEVLEIIIAVFSDQMFSRKDFLGLGLFMKVPPGFQEHQAYFESFVLSNTLPHLGNTIKLGQKLLWEPRVLTNLARLATHVGEAIYEGWFIDGAGSLLDFLGGILEYLQRPDIMSMKSTRLCSQLITTMKEVLLRVVLLRLSELDESVSPKQTVSFLEKLVYWQTVLLSIEDTHEDFLTSLCYLLYGKLVITNERVRMTAANFWRMLLVQKPEETADILQHATTIDNSSLTRGFEKLMELDNESFLSWVDDHREGLDSIFLVGLSKKWEDFVTEENQKTEATAKARINKRREKLKLWHLEELANDDILRRHEISSDHWRSNIYASESLKRQRSLQDQQDNQAFNNLTWERMIRELRRPCGIFDDSKPQKWQLDQTEGRNRMRMRLILDKDAHLHDYQPKRKQSVGPVRHRRSLGIRKRPSMRDAPASPHPSNNSNGVEKTDDMSLAKSTTSPELSEEESDADDDFEIIEDPRDQSEDYEDKNRKVMRSIHRGDQVEHVHNVSRIVGLEACEGLLILGKGYLYLMDNLFQRSDGEIVNVWQAPQEERDPYLQMISGREAGERNTTSTKTDRESRNWRWDDVLSISKRRFLFRDVAVEVFFVDGRSYLLTSNNPQLRDDLCQKLLSKAPNLSDRASSLGYEDSWRIDSIRNPEDQLQTFGSRFTNVFAQNFSNPATRKWMKGDISNFHYLMLVNTMAGRTFNDLTQYPVFPWVLADYTSEELDLTDPRSFRDLTKPMGCQNPERQAEFRDRYQSFAEMGDHNSPPFHYGTHYSSAMIVTSYLIRLQPFVKSYLLLQGGNFDHPDRLFYSIEKAWSSASRENMTDVRELIPEFYYLPEFLLNSNGYDFGSRQGNGGSIDTVVLPPWAKGDPRIFVAKNREALESEYVSKNLHQWIDLVFGHKQRGEAALEATNVFHHLSYHGAKNLDTIDDPVERLATIGIIHNFGQTPHQVFQRSHPQREETKHKVKRLDTAAENLTRLPFPLLEAHDRISSLSYSYKHDRVLSSSPFRLNIGPAYDKFMEWGFVDNSIRFYSSESKKLLALFEHVHQGQLSTVLFADSKTLVTAGIDCTISVWAVVSTPKTIDLQPKTCLFGHRTPVTTLAVSRSFSVLLSASSDGQVLLWDLNRLEFVRILTPAGNQPVECARINDITGTILVPRGPEVFLYTLNGDPILTQNLCVEGEDLITSCAFYEGNGNEYLERELIFTGHRRGVVNVWHLTTTGTSTGFVLAHVKRMNHLDAAGFNIQGAITAVLPMAQRVFTGDEDGRVYEWDCIQRQ